MFANSHHILLFFSVQTSTSAASPATCVSTSASTAQGATPASVQTDISSRETGCVKVLHFSSWLFTNLFFLPYRIYLSPVFSHSTQFPSESSSLPPFLLFLFLCPFLDSLKITVDHPCYHPLFYLSCREWKPLSTRSVMERMRRLGNTNTLQLVLPCWATSVNLYAWCWLLEVDLFEAPALAQRVSCYFFLSPSVRCRLYRGSHESGRLCQRDLLVMNPGCCARNSPVVWGAFDGVIFMVLWGKRCS